MLTLMAKPVIYRIEPLSLLPKPIIFRIEPLSLLPKPIIYRIEPLIQVKNIVTNGSSVSLMKIDSHTFYRKAVSRYFSIETSHLFYVLSLRKLTISSKIYVRVYFSMKLYVDYFV